MEKMYYSLDGMHYPNDFWRAEADGRYYARSWNQPWLNPLPPRFESPPPVWFPDVAVQNAPPIASLVSESWNVNRVMEWLFLLLIAVFGLAIVLAFADKPGLLKALWFGAKWIVVHALQLIRLALG